MIGRLAKTNAATMGLDMLPASFVTANRIP
jgi:hypothetical protein